MFHEAGIEGAAHDAEVLLTEVLGLTRGQLFARTAEALPPAVAERFASLVARRRRREPLQHVVGHWPFLDLDLLTDRRALVPRPETEDLALRAIAVLPGDRDLLVLDAGTGTGCLALAIAASRPRARVVALDRDAGALSLAAENRSRCGLAGRVALLRGDLCGPLDPATHFDLAVANLPYVREDEVDRLEPEVRDHDPRAALVAADGGLALIRRFVVEARPRLLPGARLLLECAPDQAEPLARELPVAGWRDATIRRDRFDRPRIVEAVR